LFGVEEESFHIQLEKCRQAGIRWRHFIIFVFPLEKAEIYTRTSLEYSCFLIVNFYSEKGCMLTLDHKMELQIDSNCSSLVSIRTYHALYRYIL
jgi:hypothetical protein